MKIFSKIEEFKAFFGDDLGKILSLDIGTKKIGMAVCDETRIITTPKLVLKRLSNRQDFEKIAEIIAESRIKALVIGMPTNLDGSEIGMTGFVWRFVENFVKFWQESSKTEIPIILWDERLSSFEARNMIAEIPSGKRKKASKKFYDDIAATVILEHFLHDLRNC